MVNDLADVFARVYGTYMKQNISLKDIVTLISGTGGYLVFPGEDGREYVVADREDFEGGVSREVQLAFPVSDDDSEEPPTADDILEKINRDIALFQMQQEEEDSQFEDYSDEEEADQHSHEPVLSDALETSYASFSREEDLGDEVEPPRRVRFEPLHGDLPPDLQE